MIDAFVFGDDGISRYDELSAARDAEGTTWIHAPEVTDAELDAIAETFAIHPLTVEDLRNGVRAKTETFPEYTFVLLKTITLAGGETTFAEELSTTPIGLFVGHDWVVSVSPGAGSAVDRVRHAVEREDERLLQHGADFTAYRVIEVVVDDYFEVLDRVEDLIEAIEDEVIDSPDRETLERINAVRRDLLSFRKQIWPAREAVGVLARGDPPQVQPQTEKYFRDVYDHLVQLADLTETYRDLVSGARDIYLNALSQSTNEVMKTLTVVATIFIPLTFVAGVYGMNFDPAASPYNMPELGWAYGYPAVLVAMALIGVAMLAYFRRQDYL
ncbi:MULTISPECIES: magnesium/cobalt transporter CorA [Halomicrobium]|uniref:Magnesium transport protein CorA n=2 Tax=Halomicrobium mukohataei TaxID=57705 RepID=C7NWT5_HALMD|nr:MULTISPECIES: magnesium/cobalt transporter CorA [Halomicrobium]ACV48295.1 magnesium and cobalt transport protein CorA [Halomicrobium mukohataei DSM 12286]QCD66712.1 magnesium/cobalt transporter CorA [Halomicrobium mukohataei]QFR21518.1 magnesium/cobalt transporter CorA [Halomicrobium sp. ZPS1]